MILRIDIVLPDDIPDDEALDAARHAATLAARDGFARALGRNFDDAPIRTRVLEGDGTTHIEEPASSLILP